MKTMSIGSLIAVLNLTMLRAPTIPSESTMLVVTAIITREVTMAIMTSDTLKLLVYIIPWKVLLYT